VGKKGGVCLYAPLCQAINITALALSFLAALHGRLFRTFFAALPYGTSIIRNPSADFFFGQHEFVVVSASPQAN